MRLAGRKENQRTLSRSDSISSSPDNMPCPDCLSLDGANVSVSPHANLLLHSDAGINFGATASGHVEYYVCNACATKWERIRARSEPEAQWRHTEKELE